jgi:hypothetical protein
MVIEIREKEGKKAYQISQDFKYGYQNHIKTREEIKKDFYNGMNRQCNWNNLKAL